MVPEQTFGVSSDTFIGSSGDMMKINEVLRSFVTAAGLAGVFLAAPVPASVLNQFSPAGSQSARARDEVVARIRADYVDPVDEDKLTQGDLRELVRAVDPESEYLDQEKIYIWSDTIFSRSRAGKYPGQFKVELFCARKRR